MIFEKVRKQVDSLFGLVKIRGFEELGMKYWWGSDMKNKTESYIKDPKKIKVLIEYIDKAIKRLSEIRKTLNEEVEKDEKNV